MTGFHDLCCVGSGGCTAGVSGAAPSLFVRQVFVASTFVAFDLACASFAVGRLCGLCTEHWDFRVEACCVARAGVLVDAWRLQLSQRRVLVLGPGVPQVAAKLVWSVTAAGLSVLFVPLCACGSENALSVGP